MGGVKSEPGKPLTCPTCRAPTGPPAPARALNEVCIALEDDEVAARRNSKEEMDAHQRYEALLERERAQAEAKPRESEMAFPLGPGPVPQVAVSHGNFSRANMLFLSRGPINGGATTPTPQLTRDNESLEFSASGLATPMYPAVNVRIVGTNAVSAGPTGAHAHLQASVSNAASQRAEDRLHVESGSDAYRVVHVQSSIPSFRQAERS